MIDILTTIENKYVPTYKSLSAEGKTYTDVIKKISFGGDQLTEERAINVQRAFDDGDNDFEKLKGPDPKFEDWHLKRTLYKVSIA